MELMVETYSKHFDCQNKNQIARWCKIVRDDGDEHWESVLWKHRFSSAPNSANEGLWRKAAQRIRQAHATVPQFAIISPVIRPLEFASWCLSKLDSVPLLRTEDKGIIFLDDISKKSRSFKKIFLFSKRGKCFKITDISKRQRNSLQLYLT